MRRKLRVALVAVLVGSLSMDYATACHLFQSYWGGGCGPTYTSYHSAPVDYYGGCGGSYYGCSGCEQVVADGCCGGEVVGPPTDRAPLSPPPQPPSPATVNRPGDRFPAPQLPPDDSTFTGEDTRSTPPAGAAPPEDRMMPPPVDVAPPVDRTTPPPAEDDLFGPVGEPAAPADDDLFGPAGEPSAPADDDLFAPGAGSQPETPPENADLFGPADSPPADEDDLFGAFGEPATPTSNEGAAADESIDMFDAPADDQPPAESAVPPAEEATEEDDDDDPFGSFGAILREPGGFASNEMRQWVDNTGSFTCQGRVVRFTDGHVQLLKDNGRTTTVPLFRLSESDLQFVHRQASAQKSDAMGQTAQATPAGIGAWASN